MENIVDSIRNFIKNGSVFAKVAIGLFPVLILIAIITVFVFTRTPEVDNNVKVADFSDISDAPQNYKNETEQRIWNYIRSNDYFSDASDFEAKIREGTYKKEEVKGEVQESFIVDIDALRYSFDVKMKWSKNRNIKEDLNISITCPHYLDVIYPDTKCIIDSPMQQIKRYLPHYGKVNGVKYAVSYKKFNDTEYLQVEVPACGDSALIEKVDDSINEWIESIYLDPDDYTTRIADICNS